MKSIPKLVRRFIGILLLSMFLLLLLNIAVLAVIGGNQRASGSPYTIAGETGKAFKKTKNGYELSKDAAKELQENNIWAILIDNYTLQVVWHTDNLPDSIPRKYSISDISKLTLGYIDDYPTYTGEADGALAVLGFPKDSFWKSMWPSWDYYLIANLPYTILKVLLVNIILIFIIYTIANTKLLASVKPITEGIQNIAEEEPVHIREKGLLSEIAANINRTSDILQSQKHLLRKKEMARANWIAGVSHDIRTPLSSVMGYAGQLADSRNLSAEEQKKAAAIVKQSERIRNLINDLNLASKLEYNMQPLTRKKENAVSIVRQVAVDFINMDIDEKYPVAWEGDGMAACFVNADKGLLKRAISNLIQNSINHNEDGCHIYVSVCQNGDKCVICVEDDGIGVSSQQIESLRNMPHYMVCDSNTKDQRHGLGLLIVKQIAVSHDGQVEIAQSPYGGLAVRMILPVLE